MTQATEQGQRYRENKTASWGADEPQGQAATFKTIRRWEASLSRRRLSQTPHAGGAELAA